MKASIVERAKKIVSDSRLGSNPRNRLYMSEGAIEIILELIAELEKLDTNNTTIDEKK